MLSGINCILHPVGTFRGARAIIHIEARTSHKQERHHTLTQNLKAMGLWEPLLFYLMDTCLYRRSCTRATCCLYRRCSFLQLIGGLGRTLRRRTGSDTRVGTFRGARATIHIEARTPHK